MEIKRQLDLEILRQAAAIRDQVSFKKIKKFPPLLQLFCNFISVSRDDDSANNSDSTRRIALVVVVKKASQHIHRASEI